MWSSDALHSMQSKHFRHQSKKRCNCATGFGAAKHLAEEGYAVTLLDAAPEPGGLATGFRTKDGRACEAGIKGFWYEVRQSRTNKVGVHTLFGTTVKLLEQYTNLQSKHKSFTYVTFSCLHLNVWGVVAQYHNIFALVRSLGIWPFTPWSRSGFWGPRGLAIEVRTTLVLRRCWRAWH